MKPGNVSLFTFLILFYALGLVRTEEEVARHYGNSENITMDSIDTSSNIEINVEADGNPVTHAKKRPNQELASKTMRWRWGAVLVGGDVDFAVVPKKRVPKILVIGIISKTSNVDKRNAIRETWASRERTGVAIKFILGYSRTPELQPEDIDMPDVLRVPVVDSYRNVLRKTLHFFDWAMNYHNPAYIMKTDDDTYLALDAWIEKLGIGGVGGSFAKQRVYYGHFWTGSPIRDRNHKNFASYECYPLPLFAPYAHGAAMLLSFDLVKHLVDNQAMLAAGMMQRCGNLEDAQFGRWLFGLGVAPRHDHRLSDIRHCHSESLALLDVSPDAMRSAHKAHIQGLSLCTSVVRRDAQDAYSRQLQVSPSNPRLHNNLGVQKLLNGEWAGAVAHLQRADELETRHQGPKMNLQTAERVVLGDCDAHCQTEVLQVFDNAILQSSRRISVPHFDDPDHPLYASFAHIFSDF